jgi:hypothetical protein
MLRFGRQRQFREFGWGNLFKIENQEREVGRQMNAGGEDGRREGSDGGGLQ